MWFVSVPEIGEPDPLVPIPKIFGELSLSQVKAVPVTLFKSEMTILVIPDPEQIDWLVFVALTSGIGLTVTAAVVVDEQVPAVAVIMKVVVIGAVVLLVKAPVIGDPDPLASMPGRLEKLSLSHVKAVPLTPFGLEITIGTISASEQTGWAAGRAFTVGFGFTNTVAVVVLEHPSGDVAVIVKIVVC